MTNKLKLINQKADDILEQLQTANINDRLRKQILVVINWYKEIINLLIKND